MNLKKRSSENKMANKTITGPQSIPVNSSEEKIFFYPENSWKFVVLYHSILLCGAFYGLYNFYLISQRWKKRLELTKKQSFFGVYQDQNDVEWKIFIPLLLEFASYGILHLVLAQIIRHFYPVFLKVFYIIFSSFMAVKMVGVWGIALCYLIPVVMFVVLLSRLRIFIWLTWCLLLIIFNFRYFEEFIEMAMNDHGEEQYKTSVIVAWIMLRCVSFCLVTCDEDPTGKRSRLSSFIDILAYSLYFPHFVTGPYVPYKDFEIGVNKPFESWNIAKVLWFIGQCGRFLFWLCLSDVLLYFFYAHALIFDPGYLRSFDPWTMAGYYSFLLIFFILKYVVMYGLPSVLARAEGFDPPPPPRCVLFIERFSHVWKYFDVGLHRFMLNHIYIPFLGTDTTTFRQVQACVVAFTFVYVWHGAYPSVFWWCVINFALTVVEKVADQVIETTSYKHYKKTFLPGFLGSLFGHAVVGAFFSVATNSILIFLTSTEHAAEVFNNIFVKGFPLTTASTVFFFALLYQSGLDLHNFRQRRKLRRS